MEKKQKSKTDDVRQSRKLRPGIGSVYQKKAGGLFFYRYQVNGEMKAVSLGTDDIDEAEKIARAKFMPIVGATSEEIVAAHVKVARKMSQEGKRLFLCDAWEEYSKRPDRATPATVAEVLKYRGTLEQFIRVVDTPNIMVSEITHEHAKAFVEYLKKLELSVDTHNRKIKQLRRIFRVLADCRQNGENPFASASLLRKSREDQHISTRRLSFTKEQEMKLIEELRNPNRVLKDKDEIRIIFLIGMYTGQRLKDCVLLRWSKVDFKQRFIDVIQYKTGKEVQLPIANPLMDALNEALQWRMPGNDYVCPHVAERYNKTDSRGKNTGAGYVNLDVMRVIRWIGVKTSEKTEGRKKSITVYGFHSLRHSFVSFCAEAGVPKSVVQSFTGTDAEIIDHYYTHVGSDQQVKALEAVVGNLGRLTASERIDNALKYIDSIPEDSLNDTILEIKRLLTQELLEDKH